MPSYTNSTPGAGEVLANSQPLMLANTQYLQTSIGIDHNFTNNTVTSQDGYHKVIHFVNQGGDPAPVASTGEAYTKTDANTASNEFFYQNPAGVVAQLTGYKAIDDDNGWAWMGGFLVQWGRITSTTSSGFSTDTVSFSGRVAGAINFPSNCFTVLTTPVYSSTDNPSSAISIALQRGSLSNTGFRYGIYTNSSDYRGFRWVAIGN